MKIKGEGMGTTSSTDSAGRSTPPLPVAGPVQWELPLPLQIIFIIGRAVILTPTFGYLLDFVIALLNLHFHFKLTLFVLFFYCLLLFSSVPLLGLSIDFKKKKSVSLLQKKILNKLSAIVQSSRNIFKFKKTKQPTKKQPNNKIQK